MLCLNFGPNVAKIVQVTTGPLGQGVANAVGLAMATKHLMGTYNQPGFEVVNNHTWCMVGDACLQEVRGICVNHPRNGQLLIWVKRAWLLKRSVSLGT